MPDTPTAGIVRLQPCSIASLDALLDKRKSLDRVSMIASGATDESVVRHTSRGSLMASLSIRANDAALSVHFAQTFPAALLQVASTPTASEARTAVAQG